MSEVDWHKFDAIDYMKSNYSKLSLQDAALLSLIWSWCVRCRSEGLSTVLEVGCGPDPRILKLSSFYFDMVRGLDPSANNVTYLTQVLSKTPAYLREQFNYIYSIVSPKEEATSDVGIMMGPIHWNRQREVVPAAQMHFVAESCTDDVDKFEEVCRDFLGTIQMDGAFCVSMMIQSEGYEVGGVQYPAVSLGTDRLQAPFMDQKIHSVNVIPNNLGTPIRKGYGGILHIQGYKTKEV